jgi:hypothetical protein
MPDGYWLGLPGAFYAEGVEAAGFGLVHVVLDYVVDAGAAGAFAEAGAKLVEVAGAACGDDFDVAVLGVADPAAEVELGGLALDEPAEADALDAAADQEVENHG